MPSPLESRVAVLRLWAEARIKRCRIQECSPDIWPTAEAEAAAERRALQAVLALLEEETG